MDINLSHSQRNKNKKFMLKNNKHQKAGLFAKIKRLGGGAYISRPPIFWLVVKWGGCFFKGINICKEYEYFVNKFKCFDFDCLN